VRVFAIGVVDLDVVAAGGRCGLANGALPARAGGDELRVSAAVGVIPAIAERGDADGPTSNRAPRPSFTVRLCGACTMLGGVAWAVRASEPAENTKATASTTLRRDRFLRDDISDRFPRWRDAPITALLRRLAGKPSADLGNVLARV
jgi:hypothetical protein